MLVQSVSDRQSWKGLDRLGSDRIGSQGSYRMACIVGVLCGLVRTGMAVKESGGKSRSAMDGLSLDGQSGIVGDR